MRNETHSRPLNVLIAGGGVAAREAPDGRRRAVADVCPWDPPTKIVARHPGPYPANGNRGFAAA
jgi:hypothetical protein